MSIETELKLHIAPKYADKLAEHPLLQSATHQKASQHLYSTYFDTKEHALLKQGVGLRVRRIGDRRVQTLKTAGSGSGGLHQRQEWETDIVGETPEYSQFPEGALPEWCANKNNLEQIEALFVTEFMRTTWLVAIDGSEIEVALDQGEVKTPTASRPLNEVELELKSGSADKLFSVALTLQEALPLLIENQSKAAGGYALHQPKPPKYHKAGAVKLNPNMTAEQAFVHILWHCLGHLQANEDMVLYGQDIEGVHQMRVALRRLRSCLSLYEPLIPKKIFTKLRREAKWITDVLGVARDWDVFALSLEQMQQPDNNSSLKNLPKRVANKKRHAYAAVRAALRSPRYSRMLLLFGKWLTQRRWRRKLEDDALSRLDSFVIDFASPILESHHQLVKKQGKNLVELSAEELHELRISIKQLAYGTRFFAELYPCFSVRPYTKSLKVLQDELGILNDGSVASGLLDQAGLDKKAPARHFFKGWYAHQQVTHFAQLEAAWQAFLEQKIFWRMVVHV
jgi:triphosphatase